MLDFGALPPEVNSARMYAGPGSGPLMAAASAWDALAGQLDSFAVTYSSTISDLQGESWSGGASIAMASAAAPYVAWAAAATAQAEQAANQARAAAAAYEMAFTATVPPAVVAGNRIQLASLVATNFFGQNTMMIAAAEAAYAEMWAQDAAAMYGYAASSSAAATLTQFSEPPPTTNAAGQSGQAAAVTQAAGTSTAGHSQTTLSALMSTLPQHLQTLATVGSSGGSNSAASSLASSPLITAFSDLNTFVTGPLTPFYQATYSVFQAGQFGTGLRLVQLQEAKAAAKSATPAVIAGVTTPGTGGVRGEVFASVDSAERVGKLSVPQSWAAATPATSAAAEPLRSTGTGFRALPAWGTNPPTGMAGGLPTAGMGPRRGMVARRPGNKVLRMRDRRFKMPRPTIGG